MMAEETDGIEEAFEGQLRVLVTAAGQVGEQLARAREEALRTAQAHSEQEHHELQSRIAAEMSAARIEIANVHRSVWWDRATPEQIGRTYQLARAWSQEDPEAARAEQRMCDELRARYGIDVNDIGGDPEAVRQRIHLELDRARGDAERGRSAAEHAEAQRLLAQADHEDQLSEEGRAAKPGLEATANRAREDGHILYDSAERREGTARALEAKGISQEVVAIRMRADVSQAKPATEAVKAGAVARATKARKTRGRVAQAQRSGLDR